jgi:hypothetical protein
MLSTNFRHAQDKGTRLEQRSARRLYNNAMAPIKGRYNGWGFNQSCRDISWNLYDKSTDLPLGSSLMKYLWICVYNSSGSAQTFKFSLTDDSTTQIMTFTTSATTGRQVLWARTDAAITVAPSKQTFNLLPDSENRVDNIQGDTITITQNLSKWDLTTDGGTDNFYLESFGYSTNSTTIPPFNMATLQMFDARIPEEMQIHLDNQNGYDMLYSRFIRNGSGYPMDKYNTSATFNDPSTDAQV